MSRDASKAGDDDHEPWVEELVRDCIRHFHASETEPYRLTPASPKAHSFPLEARREAIIRLQGVGFPVRVLDETDMSFEVERIPRGRK